MTRPPAGDEGDEREADNDGEGAVRCPLCDDEIELADGTRLRLRHLSGRDEAAIEDLYTHLDRRDLVRRFFTGSQPPHRFFEQWASVGERGGFVLGAELDGDGGTRLVGEAGYSLLDSGDGELGIAVDPGHRGWLGGWLLDALFRHAAERGVPNIQALVLADNRAMLALARRRPFAVLEHPDHGIVRLTMSVDRGIPSWPAGRGRPRVLVESQRTRWPGEALLGAEGYDVAICNGPCRSFDSCPLMAGEPCPLVDGADAIVLDLPADDPDARKLLETHPVVHPAVRLVAGWGQRPDGTPKRRPAAELLHEIDELSDSSSRGDQPGTDDGGRRSTR